MKLVFASFRSREEAFFKEGFTLVELLVAIGLIGVLATLSAPQLGTARERIEKIVCIGHLRSLHVSLGAYLNDNEEWPQCPEDLEGETEEKFWFDALKDYGAQENVWQCPTTVRRLGSDMDVSSSNIPKMHYTPTTFDDNPMSPRLWATMPWLIERGDAHHGGNLAIFPDGSVQSIIVGVQDVSK